MVAIKENLQNLRHQAQQGLNQFGHKVENAINKVGNNVANGANLAVTPAQQKLVEGKIGSKIDDLYGKIGQGFGRAVDFLENNAANTLNAPIKGMSELHITRLEIKEDDSSKAKAAKKAVNGLVSFHEAVAQKGEAASRTAGNIAHGLTRGALSPIRFAAKLLQIEPAGALVQNTIALAVGFAVRGIVLALSQLGHIAPYAAAAAVIGGTVLGLAALGHFVSPLAAVGIATVLVLGGLQLQIHLLGKKVDLLTQEVRKQQAPTLLNRLHARLPERKTVAKVAAALAIAAAVAGLGYAYGGAGAQYAGEKLAQAQEFAQPAIEVAGKYANSGYNFVADGATVAKDAIVGNAGRVVEYGRSFFAQEAAAPASGYFSAIFG